MIYFYNALDFNLFYRIPLFLLSPCCVIRTKTKRIETITNYNFNPKNQSTIGVPIYGNSRVCKYCHVSAYVAYDNATPFINKFQIRNITR